MPYYGMGNEHFFEWFFPRRHLKRDGGTQQLVGTIVMQIRRARFWVWATIVMVIRGWKPLEIGRDRFGTRATVFPGFGGWVRDGLLLTDRQERDEKRSRFSFPRVEFQPSHRRSFEEANGGIGELGSFLQVCHSSLKEYGPIRGFGVRYEKFRFRSFASELGNFIMRMVAIQWL